MQSWYRLHSWTRQEGEAAIAAHVTVRDTEVSMTRSWAAPGFMDPQSRSRCCQGCPQRAFQKPSGYPDGPSPEVCAV